MIVITGAAGFISSALIARLNQEGIFNLMLVDDFSHPEKQKNYQTKKFLNTMDRMDFLNWFPLQADTIDLVFHLGARTDTTEKNVELLNDLNLNYSKEIFSMCTRYQIPLIYASSAATYGNGEFGYDDEIELEKLKPLNAYGVSKNDFDQWVLQQQQKPPHWYGLKFFNVFGPNEYHKNRMASVVLHGFHQIKSNGVVKLFRSHRSDIKDGEQKRDFIYVKDVVDVLRWLMHFKAPNGIYNLGTGTARTFIDLATATFNTMQVPVKIEWIDIPEDIREKYQYFTEAKMDKLKNAGYPLPFTSLEDSIQDYVKNYLSENKIY